VILAQWWVSRFKAYKSINLTLLDQVIVSGVNFLTGIMIARYIGIEQFGIFSLIWMLVLFAGSLQLAIITTPMMNLMPKQSIDSYPLYFNAVIVHQLVFSALSATLLIISLNIMGLIMPEFKEIESSLLGPFGAVIITTQFQDFMRRYFFVNGQPFEALLNDSISYIGQVALLIFLDIYTQSTIESIFWVISCTSLLAIIHGFCNIKIQYQFDLLMLQDITIRHWRFAKWLILSTILQWGSGNFLMAASSVILGTYTLGVLKAIQNILGVANIVLQGLNNFVPIVVSKLLSTGGFLRSERYILKITGYSILGILLLCSPILIFPIQTVRILYDFQLVGQEYIIYWFVAINIAMLIVMVQGLMLNAIEEPKPQFTSYLVSTIISLSIAYPLIKQFDVMGTLGGMFFIILVRIALLHSSYLSIRKEKMREFNGTSFSSVSVADS
jgi:O-antigen/teichoic acid export membrane protein